MSRTRRRFSFLPLAAALLLLAGMGAILMPVLQMDREIRRDVEEYAQLREAASLPAEAPFRPPDADAEGNPLACRVQPSAAPPDRFTGADLAACLAQNDDFIAWIRIPGTNVDYPVVWTDDAEHYLHHTFTGKQGAAGTLFSLMKTDYSIPSRNIAIYGHHLKSTGEKMFTSLMRYKDADFYAGHETVLLDTLYESGSYRIFAVLNFRSGEWDASQADFESDAAFLEFIRYARRNALYDTGVTVGAEDSILTLITCDRSYGGKAGRLAVVAVLEKSRRNL